MQVSNYVVENNLYMGEDIAVDKNVLFYKRIADLVKNVKKCSKSLNSKKLTETLFKIKDEVEDFTGQRIHLENCYNQVINELKNSGVELTKKEIKTIWKKLSGKHKKHLAISQDLAYYFDNGIELDELYQDIELGFNDYIIKSQKDKHDKEGQQEIPIRVEIGVSIALCGLFLMCIPYPVCVTTGRALMGIGAALASEGVFTRMKDDQKERNKKERLIQ